MIRPTFESMTTQDLAQWWEETVGYDPLSPEGGWEADELPTLCAELFDEMQSPEGEV